MQEFIDRLGKAAQQTAADTRLRLGIRNLGGKLDEDAQALGHLLFRRHVGENVAEEEMLKLLNEMTQLKSDRKARETELEALHKAPASEPTATAEPAPAAEPAPSATPSEEASGGETAGQPTQPE